MRVTRAVLRTPMIKFLGKRTVPSGKWKKKVKFVYVVMHAGFQMLALGRWFTYNT